MTFISKAGREPERIVVLWSAPRSASTAFEKAFQQRGDTDVVHEPYTDCYYFSRWRRSARYGDAADYLDYDGHVAEREICDRRREVVFVKELAFQALHYSTDHFLTNAINTFLIRQPAAVYQSLLALKPDFTEEEFGFGPMWSLYTRIGARGGRVACVVDSDALRESPHAVLSDYCSRIGIGFDAKMLSWRPGPIRPWDPHEQQSQAKWHRTLEASTGILPPIRTCRDVLPQHVGILARADDVYRRLRLISFGLHGFPTQPDSANKPHIASAGWATWGRPPTHRDGALAQRPSPIDSD
jgi:hypothetical protein